MPGTCIPALCLEAAGGVHSVTVCSPIPQGLKGPPTGFQQEEALQTALEAALCSAVPGLGNMPKHVSVSSNKPTGGQLELPATMADDPGGIEGLHGGPESVFSEASTEPAAPGGAQEQPGMTTQFRTAGMAGGPAAAPEDLEAEAGGPAAAPGGVEAEAGKASAAPRGAPSGANDASVSGTLLQPEAMEGTRAGEAITQVRNLWPCMGHPYPPGHQQCRQRPAACAMHSVPQLRGVPKVLLKRTQSCAVQMQAKFAEQGSRSSSAGRVTQGQRGSGDASEDQPGSEESRWPLLRTLTHSLWRWHCAAAGHAQPAQQDAASPSEGEIGVAHHACSPGRRWLCLTHAKSEQLCAKRSTSGPHDSDAPCAVCCMLLGESYSPELGLVHKLLQWRHAARQK